MSAAQLVLAAEFLNMNLLLVQLIHKLMVGRVFGKGSLLASYAKSVATHDVTLFLLFRFPNLFPVVPTSSACQLACLLLTRSHHCGCWGRCLHQGALLAPAQHLGLWYRQLHEVHPWCEKHQDGPADSGAILSLACSQSYALHYPGQQKLDTFEPL